MLIDSRRMKMYLKLAVKKRSFPPFESAFNSVK